MSVCIDCRYWEPTHRSVVNRYSADAYYRWQGHCHHEDQSLLPVEECHQACELYEPRREGPEREEVR